MDSYGSHTCAQQPTIRAVQATASATIIPCRAHSHVAVTNARVQVQAPSAQYKHCPARHWQSKNLPGHLTLLTCRAAVCGPGYCLTSTLRVCCVAIVLRLCAMTPLPNREVQLLQHDCSISKTTCSISKRASSISITCHVSISKNTLQLGSLLPMRTFPER